MTLFRLTTAAALAGAFALPAHAQQDARFEVTQKVAAPETERFTATLGAFGNGASLTPGGGFEPVILRNMFLASGGDEDSILSDAATLTDWDSWTEGTFDGAEVDVLRIENGRFVQVRRGHVAPEGYHASGWSTLTNQPLPPDQTTYLSGWDRFNRLGVPYYYTVRAVDGSGRLSPAAPAVAVSSPSDPKGSPKAPSVDIKIDTGKAASLAAPAGLTGQLLRGDGVARLTWEPVPGARGYVVYRSDTPEDRHRGYSIDLADSGAAVRQGDLVILRRRVTDIDRSRLVSSRLWGAHQSKILLAPGLVESFPDDPGTPPWHLEAHEAGTPVEAAGETFLRVDLPGGKPFVLGNYNHSGTTQSWYEVLDPSKTYRYEVWLRGPADATATFAIEGPFGGQAVPGLPARFALTPEWKRHSVEFRVPSTTENKQVGRMNLTLGGVGQVDVDNVRIYRADAPYLAFLPEDAQALRDFAPSGLRTHALIKTGHRTYDLDQLTNPAGVTGVQGGNTLDQTLTAIASVGSMPWVQIEPHMSPEEWKGLAEYLAAPADAGPWAAKRAEQGQVEPWTDVFDTIRFEIGNETWNNIFAPWTFRDMRDGETGRSYNGGEVYGLYQEYVLSILEESPAWEALAPHLVPVLGGWTNREYGYDAARRSPRSQILAHADYIGGWDRGEGPVSPTPEGFASVLGHTPQETAGSVVIAHDMLDDLPRREVPLRIGTYESGPGYALNGLNGGAVTDEQSAAQEEVMKSVAAGTATLDSFLTRMRAGDTVQNFFTFGRGENWKSHAKWYHGGQAYPSWSWLGLTNRELMGDMLEVRAREVPLADLPAIGRRQLLEDAPMIGVQAMRKDDRLSVIVLSRLLPEVPAGQDGHAAVEVTLPITGAGKLTRYTMTGDYAAHNILADNAWIVEEDLPVPANPADLRIDDLQPGSVQVYVFDGVR